jgi:hypothetical protein
MGGMGLQALEQPGEVGALGGQDLEFLGEGAGLGGRNHSDQLFLIQREF